MLFAQFRLVLTEKSATPLIALTKYWCLRCSQKVLACMEHLLLIKIVPTARMQRLSVPVQTDDVSCGWRTALNALLLIKRIFNIEDVSDILTCVSII